MKQTKRLKKLSLLCLVIILANFYGRGIRVNLYFLATFWHVPILIADSVCGVDNKISERNA